jgi:hypothetical protein
MFMIALLTVLWLPDHRSMLLDQLDPNVIDVPSGDRKGDDPPNYRSILYE